MTEKTEYPALVSHRQSGSRSDVVEVFGTMQAGIDRLSELRQNPSFDVEPTDYEVTTVVSEGRLFVDVETGEEYTDETGNSSSEYRRIKENLSGVC